MTVHFDDWEERPGTGSRGGAPVAVLGDLAPVERRVVVLFRLWCDGAAGQAEIRRRLAAAVGAGRAANDCAADDCGALGELFGLVLRGARRPLIRHAADCSCVGADENALAGLIAASAAGAREDAALFALALLQPKAALPAVLLAEPVGLMLLALARAERLGAGAGSAEPTRH